VLILVYGFCSDLDEGEAGVVPDFDDGHLVGDQFVVFDDAEEGAAWELVQHHEKVLAEPEVLLADLLDGHLAGKQLVLDGEVRVWVVLQLGQVLETHVAH